MLNIDLPKGINRYLLVNIFDMWVHV